KKFVTGVQKVGLKSVGVVERLEKENLNLYADLNKTSEKLYSVNEHRRDLIQDKEILESKVERLEVEHSSLEEKLTVANIIIQDKEILEYKVERLEVKNNYLENKLQIENSKQLEKEYELTKMTENEIKKSLVIDRLEKGYEPKNKKVADNWKGILDENKEKK